MSSPLNLNQITKPAQPKGDSDLEYKFEKKLDDDGDRSQSEAIKKLAEHNNDLRSNRTLREKTAKWSFVYLWFLTICVFIVLLFAGFLGPKFSLATPVLTTLAGGTFASAIGLPAIAMRGLFKSETNMHPKNKKKQ